MKNKKNRKYLVVLLIIILLAIAIGYAVFSSELTITGTATANSNWSVHFANPTATGDDTASLSSDDKTLTVNVALQYPGDKTTVTVDIVNEGKLDAKLKEFVITAEDGSSNEITGTNGVYTNGAIKMTLEQLTEGNLISATTGSQKYEMTFEWPENYDQVESVDDKTTFAISFNYEQAN